MSSSGLNSSLSFVQTLWVQPSRCESTLASSERGQPQITKSHRSDWPPSSPDPSTPLHTRLSSRLHVQVKQMCWQMSRRVLAGVHDRCSRLVKPKKCTRKSRQVSMAHATAKILGPLSAGIDRILLAWVRVEIDCQSQLYKSVKMHAWHTA